MANKAIRYRLYPTSQQAELIMKTVGSCRFVYNDSLSAKTASYQKDKTVLSTFDMIKRLPGLKDTYPWLKEVDSVALQQAVRHLGTAMDNFFNKKLRARFPKYKSKRKSRWSYTTLNINGNLAVLGNAVRLPKLGRVKAVISKPVPEGWVLKSATVTVERDYTVYASCLFEYDDTPVIRSLDPNNAIGLDYKSDGLYMDSNGHMVGSPKYYRKAQDTLKRAQRKLRHKTPGSRNYEKAKRRVAKIHRHVANQRKDFLHKTSAGIANRYDIVCIETLNMTSIANKGFGNGKATLDNGFGMFAVMLEYKLRDRGKQLIRVDKFYPSSQVCSSCGTIHPFVKDLSVRKWTCPDCGTVHDRDVNAAVNILHEGLRLYRESFPAVS